MTEKHDAMLSDLKGVDMSETARALILLDVLTRAVVDIAETQQRIYNRLAKGTLMVESR